MASVCFTTLDKTDLGGKKILSAPSSGTKRKPYIIGVAFTHKILFSEAY